MISWWHRNSSLFLMMAFQLRHYLYPNHCSAFTYSFIPSKSIVSHVGIVDVLESRTQLLSTPSSSLFTSGVHHSAIRTKDIENAIKFYSLLSFDVEEKFLINGEVRAAWLCNKINNETGIHSRIELIEVPEQMLGAPKELVRAADQMKKLSLLGLNHICLDVTQSIRSKQDLKIGSGNKKASNDDESLDMKETCVGAKYADDHQRNFEYGLQDWLYDLEEESKQKFKKTLRIAAEPMTRTIGYDVYDIAFIYDTDGVLVELLNHITTVKNGSIRSSWNALSNDDFIALLKNGSPAANE